MAAAARAQGTEVAAAKADWKEVWQVCLQDACPRAFCVSLVMLLGRFSDSSIYKKMLPFRMSIIDMYKALQQDKH